MEHRTLPTFLAFPNDSRFSGRRMLSSGAGDEFLEPLTDDVVDTNNRLVVESVLRVGLYLLIGGIVARITLYAIEAITATLVTKRSIGLSKRRRGKSVFVPGGNGTSFPSLVVSWILGCKSAHRFPRTARQAKKLRPAPPSRESEQDEEMALANFLLAFEAGDGEIIRHDQRYNTDDDLDIELGIANSRDDMALNPSLKYDPKSLASRFFAPFSTSPKKPRVKFNLRLNENCEYDPNTWDMRMISKRPPPPNPSSPPHTYPPRRKHISPLEKQLTTNPLVNTDPSPETPTQHPTSPITTSQLRPTIPPTTSKVSTATLQTSILIKNSRRRLRRYSAEASLRKYYNSHRRLHHAHPQQQLQ